MKKVFSMRTVTEKLRKDCSVHYGYNVSMQLYVLRGLSYSEFMGKMKTSGVEINRKVLADLAMNNPAAFSAIVEKVK